MGGINILLVRGANIPFIPLIYTDNGGRSMAGLNVSALWLVSSKFYVSFRLRVFSRNVVFLTDIFNFSSLVRSC